MSQFSASPHAGVPVIITGEPQDLDAEYTADIPRHLQGGGTHINTGALLVNIIAKNGSILRTMVYIGMTTCQQYIMVAFPRLHGRVGLHQIPIERTQIYKVEQ